MKDHPMFAMRDHPEPIIDVTRPAVPKGCHSISRAEVNELMGALLPESAAQVTNGDAGHPAIKPCEPVAADQFQPGDRVMSMDVGLPVDGASFWTPCEWVSWWSKLTLLKFRRPTAAELAEHWPDADGWIPWRGGECPVPEGSRVIIKIRGGSDYGFETTVEGEAQDWWKHYGSAHDIIAYKVLP